MNQQTENVDEYVQFNDVTEIPKPLFKNREKMSLQITKSIV